MKDETIIDLIRSGNSPKAMAALYKHYPLIRKIIQENGGNAQDAEDVFQETLIIFYRRAQESSFKLTAQLSTYLACVSRYIWKDELKKRKPAIYLDQEIDFSDTEEQEVALALEKEEDARLAEKVMNGLGDRCRELLLLFYNTKLKLKDIAAKMGYSSENTAKNQKYKCLESARNRLQELKQIAHSF